MNKKSAIMLVIVVGLIGAIIASQSELKAMGTPQTKTAAAPTPGKAVTLAPIVDHSALDDAPLDGDYVMGSEDAPITLVEYASLSCPHCAKFHKETLPKLKEHYIDTGKLRYILRQFPLNESAMSGAMLVHCVGESGGAERYYQFNNVLFSAQKKWAFDANHQKSLQTFAEVGGVSAGHFAQCLDDIEREKVILLTRKTASDELGVDATPYIFLNGHPHKGNKTFKAVKAEIDTLLAQ